MSRFWHRAYTVQYRLLAIIDPLVRAWWRRFGLGNVVDLRVRRRQGGDRARLVGLLRAGGRLYVGHPNGDVGWTRDLAAAAACSVERPGGEVTDFLARRLDAGPEREAAIRATWQHPFPGNVIYRLGRGHVRAVGAFFRLEPRDSVGGR